MAQEEKDLIRKGKQLSFLLRHDTEYKFDEHGYRLSFVDSTRFWFSTN